MAEIGVAGTIISCIDFGAKLSLALYEFAAKVNAAPSEISRLAQDITVFCSVLRQIDAVFDDTKDTQFSAQAISTISNITKRCHGCLEEILRALETVKSDTWRPKMPKRERKDEIWGVTLESDSGTNFKRRAWRPAGIGGVVAAYEDRGTTLAQRIKWVFSRSKIALLRQNLESMTITLHLMLTTLQLSQPAAREGINSEIIRENIELVAENLVLAHKLAIEDLRQAEVLAEQEPDEPLEHTKPPEPKKRNGSSTKKPGPCSKPANSSTSAFLVEAVSCEMADSRMSVATCTSRASVKSTLLATKWTTSNRHSRSIAVSSSLRNSQVNEDQMKSPAPSLLQAPKDYSSTPKQNETGISHSLRHWTELSTHLEATISQAMLRLRSSLSTESEDPLISQLCGQISSLSITCGSLSKALDQLQKEHDGIKSDYGKFLQSNVRNQEKLVEIVEKREAQVLELRNQHSIDVKKLIARIADTHTELEQMRTELESTKSARDQLSKEVDDLKLDLQAALEEAIQLTNDIKEQEAKAKNTSKEVAELRDHLRDRDNDEEALRQQIANEKAQRLIAIQHLTETFAESSSLAGDSSMLRKVSTNS